MSMMSAKARCDEVVASLEAITERGQLTARRSKLEHVLLLASPLLVIATIALVAGPSSAWSTPDDGGTYSPMDLVPISGGVVTGSGHSFSVTDDLTVSPSDTLVIGAGVHIDMSLGTTLLVNGRISVEGTATDGVVINSSTVIPKRDLWKGIQVLDSTAGTHVLRNCTIANAETGLFVQNIVSLTISDLSVHDCIVGLQVDRTSGTALVHGLECYGITENGVEVSGKSRFVARNMTIDSDGNGTYTHYTSGQGGTVDIANTRVNSGTDGLYLSQAESILVSDVTVVDVTHYGLYIRETSDFTVLDSSFSTQFSRSIQITQATGVLTNIRGEKTVHFWRTDLHADNLIISKPDMVMVTEGIARISNITLDGSLEAGIWVTGHATCYVTDAVILNTVEQLDIMAWDDSRMFLHNVTFGTYGFDDWMPQGYIVLNHSVDVRVVYPWGMPVPGATVDMWHEGQGVLFNLTTDAEGWARSPPIKSFEATPDNTWELTGEIGIRAGNGWLFNESSVPVNGTYHLTLVLRDEVPPVLGVTIPSETDEDVPFTLSAMDSTDNDPAFHGTGNVSWNVSGPATLEVFGFEPTITLTVPGTYQVSVEVTDRFGNVVNGSYELVVTDTTPPVPKADNITTEYGTATRFDGTGTRDNDPTFPEHATFLWRIDEDGTVEEYYGTTAGHTFKDPGNYSCQLVVTDRSGNSATRDFWVLVIDSEPPKAVAGPDITTKPNQEVLLTGRGSSDNHMIATYSWTLGTDPPLEVEGAEVRHTFATIGDFQVVLTVTDPSGNEATDMLWVNVTAVRPTIEIRSPANGTRVRSVLTVTGHVSSGFQKVNLSYRLSSDEGPVTDWEAMSVSGDFSFSMDIKGVDEGEYTLEVRADDGYTEPATAYLPVKVVKDDGDGDGTSIWTIGAIVVIIIIIVLVVIMVLGRRSVE